MHAYGGLQPREGATLDSTACHCTAQTDPSPELFAPAEPHKVWWHHAQIVMPCLSCCWLLLLVAVP
jgi:hypothetical protein